jgi:hypothetical protein
MIGVIVELLTKGVNFFLKRKMIEQEVQKTNAEGQIETNKEEIEKSTVHWRNFGFRDFNDYSL